MDIKSEKTKCENEVKNLETQISTLSFALKVAKAKLRQWEKLETKATEIANQ